MDTRYRSPSKPRSAVAGPGRSAKGGGSNRSKPRDAAAKATTKGASQAAHVAKMTVRDLGWTQAEAARVRAQMAAFSIDWDDPVMDVYNES